MSTNTLKAARRALVAVGGLSVLAVATSCRDFIEPKPNDVLAVENFYKTGRDAETAVNAVYGQSQWYYFWNFFLTDIATDDVLAANAGGDVYQLSQYTMDPSLWSFDEAWSNAYLTINKANIVLDRVPPIVMDEAQKRRVLGEARFLRALMYFNLVRLFGGVPIIEHELKSVAEAQTPRATADQVYALIIGDLTEAAAGLPASYSGADVGRATSGAARALLAKVYLTRGQWTDAAREAGTVIASGRYSLNAAWKDNFRIATELSNPESIFEVNYASRDEATGVLGSVHTLATLPRGFAGCCDAWGMLGANPELVALYAANDQRGFGATYMEQRVLRNAAGDSIGFGYPTAADKEPATWSDPDGPAFAKWLDETSTQNLSARGWQANPNNWIILRYADVLLMYAEAVAQGGTATAGTAEAALDRVRSRAGIGTIAVSGTALLDSIRLERRREFAFEGQRWFDLSRWNLLAPVFAAKQAMLLARGERFTPRPVPSNLFPIPQGQRNTNKQLTQNTGWE